jgi:hypothetical protein
MGKKLTPAQRKFVAKNVRLAKMNKAKDALKTKQARDAADKKAKADRAARAKALGDAWGHLG